MNRGAVGRLMAGAFLLWFSIYTYPSFLSAYSKETLGAAPEMVGAIVGSYGFTQMLLRLPLGIFSDIIKKRKPFLILGMIASILSAAGLALVRTPAGALIFRGLAGVTASTWVAHTALYSSLFRPEETTDAMGRLAAPQYGSQVIAMLAGGFLAQSIRPEAAFALGALAAAAGLFVLWRVPEQKIEVAPSPRALASVIGDKSLLISALLATVFQFACWGTVLSFTGNWASEVVGLKASHLGLLSATYLLMNTLLSPLSGRLCRRLGAMRVMLSGFLACAAACALFAFSYSAWVLFPVQALFGVGMGLILPVTVAGAIRNIDPEKRGVASGFYQSVYSTGMFSGPVVAGAVVAAFGYRVNFFAMAGVMALGAGLCTLWRFTSARSSKEAPICPAPGSEA